MAAQDQDADNLGKLTIPKLKELLKQKGLATSGNKGELIERLKVAAAGAAEDVKEGEAQEDAKTETTEATKEAVPEAGDCGAVPTDAADESKVDEPAVEPQADPAPATVDAIPDAGAAAAPADGAEPAALTADASEDVYMSPMQADDDPAAQAAEGGATEEAAGSTAAENPAPMDTSGDAPVAAAEAPAKIEDGYEGAVHDDECKDVADYEAEDEPPKDTEADNGERQEGGAAQAVVEEPKEVVESDAAEDERPRLTPGQVRMGEGSEATVNLMPTCGGSVLVSLSDSGLSQLVAAGRSNVGLSAGRYLFEVRVPELRITGDSGSNRRPGTACSLGLTTQGSSLFLGAGEDNLAFDSEGHYISCGKWSRDRLYSRWFSSHASRKEPAVFGVVVNLDSDGPNANTVTLFCDGVRACEPQPIPEALRGKPLFPTVNFRGLTLQVNLGAASFAKLPFVCRTLADAAKEDTAPARTEEFNTDAEGKAEVLFPIGLPNEGVFGWLDSFMRDNPRYTELSGRSLLDWCVKSGLQRSRDSHAGCNDSPPLDFGVKEIDDYTVQAAIRSVAPLVRRDLVVMQMRDNLLAEERKKALDVFSAEQFRRVAMVVVGEPAADAKAKAEEEALDKKRSKVGKELRQEREKTKLQKESKPVGNEDDGAKADDAEEEDIDAIVVAAVAKVELTDDEKKASWIPTCPVDDLSKKDMAKYFATFTLPSPEEGFDEIRYVWQEEEQAAQHMKTWVTECKLTQRVEDLQPGASFKDQQEEWMRIVSDWQRQQTDRRDPIKRPDKRRKVEKPAGVGGDATEAAATAATDEPPLEVTFDTVAPMEVEDVSDVGTGQPLFAKFASEDWAMLTLRINLHLLLHSFGGDVRDPERPSFHEKHLPFYYSKYFKAVLNPSEYGVSSNVELLELVRDTVEVGGKTCVLTPQLSRHTPVANFIRLTEDDRRERRRQFDAGDKNALLRVQRGAGQTRDRSRRDDHSQRRRDEGSSRHDSGRHDGRRHDSGGRHDGGGRNDSHRPDSGRQDSGRQRYEQRPDGGRSGDYSRSAAPPGGGQYASGGQQASSGNAGGYGGYRSSAGVPRPPPPSGSTRAVYESSSRYQDQRSTGYRDAGRDGGRDTRPPAGRDRDRDARGGSARGGYEARDGRRGGDYGYGRR